MPQDDSLRTKDEVQVKIHLVVPDENGADSSNRDLTHSEPKHVSASVSPGAGAGAGAGALAAAAAEVKLQDKSDSERVLFAQSVDAAKQLKELPADEFLNLLDQSSPEQIQSFLQALGPSQQPILKALPKLLGHLIQIPDEPRGAFSIIAWWEARRIFFNLVVFLCGLPTLAVLYFCGLADLDFLVKGTIEYAFLANMCYSAGWMNELVARSWWKERAKHLGPILFSLGFAFSMLLTLGAGFIAILIFVLLGISKGLL